MDLMHDLMSQYFFHIYPKQDCLPYYRLNFKGRDIDKVSNDICILGIIDTYQKFPKQYLRTVITLFRVHSTTSAS